MWTVESKDAGGRRNPYRQPTFLFRRRAEHYARKHTCNHQTVTVIPHATCRRCGNIVHDRGAHVER